MKISTTYLMLIFLALPVASFAQCELYEIDFEAQQEKTDQYHVTCGEVSSSQWTVREEIGIPGDDVETESGLAELKACTLTTQTINLGGTDGDSVSTPVCVEILNAASTTSCDDWVKIEYQLDNGEWVTQDSINACEMDPFVFDYCFNINSTDTATLNIRVVIFVDDNSGSVQSEKLRIRDGGICIGKPTEVLPVELLYFNARSQDGEVVLQWSTATEINNDFFTIERSMDGANFEAIATVDGAGNTFTESSYESYDPQPPYGTVYYRLKQTDFDGAESFSEIVPIKNSISNESVFMVFPNPTEGSFTVSMNNVQEEEVLVVLYDPMGKEIFSKVLLQENGEILTAVDPQQKLAPGIYLVVGSSNNSLYQQKLVIR